MINLDTVIDLINEKSEKFRATKNKDLNGGFALLYRDGGTIAADVNEVNIPESLLERNNKIVIGYEVYYSSKCNKSFGGLGRLRIIDDDTISNETLIEFLEDLIEFGYTTVFDVRPKMEDLLMRVSKIKKSIDEDSEDVDYLTFGNTSMYLTGGMKKEVYYIHLGYDSHEDPDLDRTRHNFIIKCDDKKYLYRYSNEFFAKDNTSVGLELSEWIDTDLVELEKEIEQYIYISRYNTIG